MCKKFEINMLKNSGDTTSFNFLSHNAHAYSTIVWVSAGTKWQLQAYYSFTQADNCHFEVFSHC